MVSILLRYFQFLIGMSSGTHVNTSDVSFLPVTAFRIEPEFNTSHLTVDGERIDHSALQAEILPGMANVFARVQWGLTPAPKYFTPNVTMSERFRSPIKFYIAHLKTTQL